MATTKIAAVIGCTGFVGSHVVDCLLQHNWTVRGLSRTATSATWLTTLPSAKPNSVTLADIDLTNATELPQALDGLLNGCTAVFFCAGTEKQEQKTIDFMVGSTQSVLTSARKNGVECMVITSSGGSTNPVGLTDETPKSEVLHWSDPKQQIAAGKFSPAAKTLMEVSCLKSVGRNQRNEVVNAELAKGAPRLCILNPNLILGPQLKPGEISGNSLPFLTRILKGEAMNKQIPNDSMSVIDVRDLAALHVACAEQSSASGRYFGVDRSYPWVEILSSFEKAYPKYQLPPMFEGPRKTPTQFDHSRKESLGVKLRSLDEMTKDVVDYLHEKKAL